METTLTIEKLERWGFSNVDMLVIAGPCSAESEDQVLQTALALAEHEVDVFRAGIWKPRSRPNTFEGIGAKGLKWLKKASSATGLPIAVEVGSPEHVRDCLRHGVDILWIGARTASNPFSVQTIAETLKGVDVPVMVKNPISPDIELWIGALERLNRVGITKLAAIHRGFSPSKDGLYRNNPNWKIPIELRRRFPNLPIICDPSHICGRAELLFSVAQKAIDLLYDGLMMEVHVNPKAALSDREQQITPNRFADLIQNLQPKTESTDSGEYQLHMNFLRKEIDDIDNRIIELFAKRMDTVEKMAIYKKEHNISIFQPNRWDEILRSRIKIGTDNNLSEDFILRVYQHIHEEAIRHQAQIQRSNKP